MTIPSKKPGVAFWATVGMVVVAAYLLGLGPALKLSKRYPTAKYLMVIYRPIGTAMFYSPTILSVIAPYARWWGNGAAISYDATGRIELLDGRPQAAP